MEVKEVISFLVSIEEKAKRYDEAIDRARKCLDEKRDTCFVRPDVIFHELAESENEKIKKCVKYAIDKLFLKEKIVCDVHKDDVLTLIENQGKQKTTEWNEEDKRCIRDCIFYLKSAKKYLEKDDSILWNEKWFDLCIAWLEKQIECVLDCPKNHQDSNRPNGCIVLEDFNGGEGFYKLHLDCLNKKQVEEVEEMIRAWNTELKTPNETIKECIGMALTDVPETRFKSYGVSLKECLDWLEKQAPKQQGKTALEAIREEKVDNANKVEPKFKVGDCIISNYRKDIYFIKTIHCGYVTLKGIDGNSYSPCLLRSEDAYHLWTIKDAKDGDILSYVTDEDDLWIMIYWSLYEPYEGHVHYHALLVNDNFTGKGTCCICIDNLKPATKEQCNLLFQKMREAGY